VAPAFRASNMRVKKEICGAAGQNYQTEQWLRMLIDGAEDYAIFAVNLQGKICTWSKGAERVFGYTEEEILGKDFALIFTPEDRDRGIPISEIERALKEGYCPDDRWHLRKDGGRLFISGAVRPLRESSKAVLGFLEVARDDTGKKATQDDLELAFAELRWSRGELARVNKELERRVRERTARLIEKVHELESFSYSLSHDMRAPLRAMRSFSQILQNEFGTRLGPEGLELLGRIATASARLDQLIQDVLTMGRLRGAHIEVQPVNLEKLLREMIRERAAFQRPGAEIEIDCPLLQIRGHEASLSQCFSNLLDNAVKFVAPGTRPRVRIWTEARDEVVRVWVQDNGIGIPKEHQERIFGMFQRLHGIDNYPGTGIGLAIVRKAVERLNGVVGVDSEAGKGSRFWVELPKV
jgi:PAS domain S-box-containing protein